jgi:DNA-binding protein YbaB
VASFAELENLAAEVDRNFRELRQRAAALTGRTVEEKVAGGAGVVRVGMGGELMAIEFDPFDLRMLDERRLGPMIVEAVHAAEVKARRTRKALLAGPEGNIE